MLTKIVYGVYVVCYPVSSLLEIINQAQSERIAKVTHHVQPSKVCFIAVGTKKQKSKQNKKR